MLAVAALFYLHAGRARRKHALGTLGLYLGPLLEAYLDLLHPLAQEGRAILLQEPALGLEGVEGDLPHLLALYRGLGERVPLLLLTYYHPPDPKVLAALAQLPLQGLAVGYSPDRPPPPVPPGTALVVQPVEGQGAWRSPLLALKR